MKEKITLAAMLLLIAAVTFTAFCPSLSNAFSGGDEKAFIKDNPLISKKGWKAIESLLSPSFYREHRCSYTPAVLLTFGAEYALFEDNPRIFHGTNLSIHIINSLLAFLLLLLLCRNPYISLTAALLFSLHPMKAEAAASISGRPVLLMSFFYLLSLISCLSYINGRRKAFYWLSFITGALSMLSDPSGLSLPFTISLLFLLMKPERAEASVKEILPFIGLSILTVLLMVLANGGFIKGIYPFSFSFPYIRSLCIGSFTFLFLTGKLLLPTGLSTYYACPDEAHISAFLLLSPLPAGALVFLILYSSLRWKETAPASVLFLIPILPCLHLFLERETLTTDLCAYLPSLGLFFLAGFFAVKITEKAGRYRREAAAVLISALLAVTVTYTAMSRQRCLLWADKESLQRDMEAHVPQRGLRSPKNAEELEKALASLSEKLKRSNDVKLLTERGLLYMQKGEWDKALEDLSRSAQARPDYAPAFYYRALLLSSQGNYNKALEDYNRAIRLDPLNTFVHLGKGNAHTALGQTEDAVDSYSQVLKNQPDNTEALIHRGTAYGSIGDYGKAAVDFDRALSINPDLPEALYRQAALAIAQGREKEAEQYITRLRSVTGDADPQYLTSLVAAFRQKGRKQTERQ